jgi:hypothetical protein
MICGQYNTFVICDRVDNVNVAWEMAFNEDAMREIEQFLGESKPLAADARTVLNDNLWDLYLT